MDANIKARWLEALRSGEYSQGQEVLRRTKEDEPDGFCCLGVLCDLAAKDGIGEWDFEGYNATWVNEDGKDREWAYLPRTVQAWAGLEQHNPRVEPLTEKAQELRSNAARTVALSYMNDNQVSFADIADHIEENL